MLRLVAFKLPSCTNTTILKQFIPQKTTTITTTDNALETLKRWASHKAGGVTRNGRDSRPKFRGTKCYEGELVRRGHILVTQLGTRVHPGENVGMSTNCTLYAKTGGLVFYKKIFMQYKRKKNLRTYVSVIPDRSRFEQQLKDKIVDKFLRKPNAVDQKYWPAFSHGVSSKQNPLHKLIRIPEYLKKPSPKSQATLE